MMRRLFTLQKSLVAQFSDGKAKPTVFDLILDKKIPSTAVYEDDKILAFKDVAPQAPVHVLIIPKAKENLTGISKVLIVVIKLGRREK